MLASGLREDSNFIERSKSCQKAFFLMARSPYIEPLSNRIKWNRLNNPGCAMLLQLSLFAMLVRKFTLSYAHLVCWMSAAHYQKHRYSTPTHLVMTTPEAWKLWRGMSWQAPHVKPTNMWMPEKHPSNQSPGPGARKSCAARILNQNAACHILLIIPPQRQRWSRSC